MARTQKCCVDMSHLPYFHVSVHIFMHFFYLLSFLGSLLLMHIHSDIATLLKDIEGNNYLKISKPNMF